MMGDGKISSAWVSLIVNGHNYTGLSPPMYSSDEFLVAERPKSVYAAPNRLVHEREKKETLVHSLYERADIQNNAIQKTMHHDKVDPTATYQLRSFKEASLQKRVFSTDRHKTQTRNSPC